MTSRHHEAERVGRDDVEPIRVLVVDDHQIWRQGVRADLERDGGFEVVAEAADGEEAVEQVRQTVPEVVLMDLSLPVVSGVEATRRIVLESPNAKVLVLSASAEEADVLEAVKAGALGYILKSEPAEHVLDAVRRVHRGEPIFTPTLAGLVLRELREGRAGRQAQPVLTGREQQILTLFAKGYGDREIAAQLSLPVGPVRGELQNILAKLQRQQFAGIPRSDADHARAQVRTGTLRRRPSGERPALERDLSGSAAFWLTMVALLAVVSLLGLATGAPGGFMQRADLATLERLRDLRAGWLSSLLRGANVLSSALAVGVVSWAVLLVTIAWRRWRHLSTFLGAILVVGWLTSVISLTGVRSAPAGVPALAATEGFSHPSARLAALATALVGVGYAVAPAGYWRRLALTVAAGLLTVLALARLYLAVEYPTQVVVGVIVGVAVPLLAFRVFTPEAAFPVTYRRGRTAHLDVGGGRGDKIRQALLDQLGIEVRAIEPFGLTGSAGSTPLRLTVPGDPGTDLFGKLYAVNHLRSDRWYKVGRMILYGALEDERPFNSVRRLVEYEDYMLRFMSDAGIASAAPYGIVELTPEREYLLVTEFLEGAREIHEASVDRATVADGLAAVRGLWKAGLAHRDIKPSNVLVRDGNVLLIDVAGCQVRPSPWRQAVDLANMMLVLALASDPELVYEEALRLFSADDIAEAFAATRGVTIPRQLAGMLAKDGRDLVGAFRALAPQRAPIAIQRWSVRRVAVTAGALAVGGIAIALALGNLPRVGLR